MDQENNKSLILKFIVVCFFTFFIGLFIWAFPYQFIKYINLPEHKVHVEWTVYSHSGPLKYQGTYKMKGNQFKGKRMSYRGSNEIFVEDDDACYYIGNQRVCIYVGTNDVDINKIEIIE